MLKSRAMFDVRIQTYWADADPAGVVFFPNFFKFIEQADEEFFRSQGVERQGVMEQHQVWLPRVEAFSKYVAPIRCGEAIRIRMTPSLKGEKAVRLDFQILADVTGAALAHGYVTMVCVDRIHFKSTALPDPIRRIYANS